MLLSKLNSLLSSSLFFLKLAISLLLAKFACLSLASKLFAVNLYNSGVVIYLTLGILFSAVVKAVVVAKLVMLSTPP